MSPNFKIISFFFLLSLIFYVSLTFFYIQSYYFELYLNFFFKHFWIQLFSIINLRFILIHLFLWTYNLSHISWTFFLTHSLLFLVIFFSVRLFTIKPCRLLSVNFLPVVYLPSSIFQSPQISYSDSHTNVRLFLKAFCLQFLQQFVTFFSPRRDIKFLLKCWEI